MTANINEAIAKIKTVGKINTRIVTITEGKCQIEIRENGDWTPIVTGVTSHTAEDIISQATNRVICG
jgi:hypothetical protein